MDGFLVLADRFTLLYSARLGSVSLLPSHSMLERRDGVCWAIGSLCLLLCGTRCQAAAWLHTVSM